MYIQCHLFCKYYWTDSAMLLRRITVVAFSTAAHNMCRPSKNEPWGGGDAFNMPRPYCVLLATLKRSRSQTSCVHLAGFDMEIEAGQQ